MNRQPLNVELLTLDDGTQKIAWDVKHLQSLLGISDLVRQGELSSSDSTTSGVNSSGIPTIETVISILDELGLKDLYEVRYRKQYATVIPKTNSKRPKVALYVVQQESEIALSIHLRIWTNHIARFHWHEYDDNYGGVKRIKELYVSEKSDFFGRFSELSSVMDFDLSDFDESIYYSSESYELPHHNYEPLINEMIEQDICFVLSSDQRFPSTSRISLSDTSELKSLLFDLKDNIKIFLQSNGEKPNDDGIFPF